MQSKSFSHFAAPFLVFVTLVLVSIGSSHSKTSFAQGATADAATATMGVVADDVNLAEICANAFDRLAIELAETVSAITRANGQTTDELAKFDSAS